jgi:hypothetical protein
MLVKCVAAPKPNALRSGEKLEVGKQYDLPIMDAQRWIRRGVVVTVEALEAVPKKPEVSDEPKPDVTAGDKPGNSGRGKTAPSA